MKFNKKYLLIILLLMISLGFAILSASVNINGTSKLANSTWDIHFENVVTKQGSVAIGVDDSAAAINPNDNTEVNYEVTLSKPGDFYEFNVDVVNAGTIDGMIESVVSTIKIGDNEPVVITANNSNLPPYLDYYISYSDGDNILPNHLLESGDTETYKVRVEFMKDIDESILPADNQSLLINIKPKMVQADNTAVEREVGVLAFTTEADLESVQDYSVRYRSNQEACVEYYSQIYHQGTDVEALCRGEDIHTDLRTTNLEEIVNESTAEEVQYLLNNNIIYKVYVNELYDINTARCEEVFGGSLSAEDLSLYCSGGVTSDGHSIADDIQSGYHNHLVELGVITNYRVEEAKPDVIITGYDESYGTEVTIPRAIYGEKVVGIADNAFKNKGITSVTVPSTVEYIGIDAFASNPLATVNIGSSRTVLNNCAFGHKENIQTHNLPNSYVCNS